MGQAHMELSETNWNEPKQIERIPSHNNSIGIWLSKMISFRMQANMFRVFLSRFSEENMIT